MLSKANKTVLCMGAVLLLLSLVSALAVVEVSAQEQPSIKVQARNLKITDIGYVGPAHLLVPTYEVLGRIVNNSSKSFDTVTVVGELYDSSGKLVGVESSYSELPIHANGGASPFKLQVLVPKEDLKISKIILTIKEDF